MEMDLPHNPLEEEILDVEEEVRDQIKGEINPECNATIARNMGIMPQSVGVRLRKLKKR